MTHVRTLVRSVAVGFITLAAVVGVSAALAYSQHAEATTTISSGDLIRGQSFSAVYYMGADGYRYVFPNDKTYFTWYSNFDTVEWMSDADLGKIQIGGNVTYKPGVKMIKINTDPKVYAVHENGALYWVDSEATATTLYGSAWNTRIDDVADAFFSNYTLSGESEDVGGTWEFEGMGWTINLDKSLVVPEAFSITSDGYSPLDATIEAGQTVRFTNNDSVNHTATGDDGSWGTGTILPGGNFVSRFRTSGTFTFTDSYDASNTGAIYVE